MKDVKIQSSFTPPSLEEMMRRIRIIREKMGALGLTHYVVTNPDNVFYLTNFANYVHERPFILVMGMDGPIRFLIPKLEIPHVNIRAVGDIELVEYFEFPAPAKTAWDTCFRALFSDDSVVGVESHCPLYVHNVINHTTIVCDIVDDARMVKSEYEISRVAYASEIALDGLQVVFDKARPGASLFEVSPQCRTHMLTRALLDNPQTNLLATNVNCVFQPPSVSHDPHNFTNVSMAMEENGPNVVIINGTVNGYGAEVERTFFLGAISEASKRPFDIMMAARAKAYELVVPGASMSEVDIAVNDIFRAAGYADNLLHRTGHSIGVTGHEGPFLAEGYDRLIEPGMFFTIEPGLYIEGIGGFRHSDTVLITEEGPVNLTPFPDTADALTF
ncbi:MAG: Xaa-Pro peptidase family protein [Pseudomonadota bacterium]